MTHLKGFDHARTVVALRRSQPHRSSMVVIPGMDLGRPILLDGQLCELCAPFSTWKDPAHSPWSPAVPDIIEGDTAGGTVVIRVKDLMPSTMGLDSQVWSWSDPQLLRVWATERVARVDEFLCRILPLATTHLLLNQCLLPPTYTPTGSGLPTPPCGSVVTSVGRGAGGAETWGPPTAHSETCFLVPSLLSFLHVVLVILLWLPNTAPDG